MTLLTLITGEADAQKLIKLAREQGGDFFDPTIVLKADIGATNYERESEEETVRYDLYYSNLADLDS